MVYLPLEKKNQLIIIHLIYLETKHIYNVPTIPIIRTVYYNEHVELFSFIRSSIGLQTGLEF